mmetsp:Transcript_22215/g.67456  ORF Transcript_22215/g.67456 Transcript_22215/m.67456 type:complete len:234 (+) Transcript_22215:3589-4290(+)
MTMSRTFRLPPSAPAAAADQHANHSCWLFGSCSLRSSIFLRPPSTAAVMRLQNFLTSSEAVVAAGAACTSAGRLYAQPPGCIAALTALPCNRRPSSTATSRRATDASDISITAMASFLLWRLTAKPFTAWAKGVVAQRRCTWSLVASAGSPVSLIEYERCTESLPCCEDACPSSRPQGRTARDPAVADRSEPLCAKRQRSPKLHAPLAKCAHGASYPRAARLRCGGARRTFHV